MGFGYPISGYYSVCNLAQNRQGRCKAVRRALYVETEDFTFQLTAPRLAFEAGEVDLDTEKPL